MFKLCTLFLSLILCICHTYGKTLELKIALSSVSIPNLKNHIVNLTAIGPRPIKNAVAMEKSTQYIGGQLIKFGYSVFHESFETEFGRRKNLLVTIKGKTLPNQVFEIGAHYDSVPFGPGADDNASGVAALLEVSRILANKSFGSTIRLCFFTGEESGLLGSYAHVKNILKNKSETLVGMISLEMLGFATNAKNSQSTPIRIPFIVDPPTTGNFIAIIGNYKSSGIGADFEDAIKKFVPNLPYFDLNVLGGFLKDSARSDHRPYWESGLKGIMLTDTANFRNPHYHKSSDVESTINYQFLKMITQGLLATIHLEY
ncbi:MAG: M20/M25/M40 family metallo-hydrolase [Bacteriovoracaceae bacterium]|nr:M20/M25/M40 family metallo-hydrolase [Bacteriovoracaceae bacterium]